MGKNCLLLFIFLLTFSISNNIYSQWVQVANGIGNVAILSLVSKSGILFAGGAGTSALYKSSNGGINWTTVIYDASINSLVANDNFVFAGGSGLYISSNNGVIWSNSLLNHVINSLAVNGNTIFAGTSDTGIFISTNNGSIWTQHVLKNHYIFTLAANGTNVFAGTRDSGLYKSNNSGLNWTRSSLNNNHVISLAVNDNQIFAGTNGFGIYTSKDNGSTWVHNSLNNQQVVCFAFYENIIFAGTFWNGVFVSNNNGYNWIQKNEGLINLDIHTLCTFNNYLFAGVNWYSVYRRQLGELIGIKPISEKIPQKFSLSQNYPNPFNPVTKIKFDIPLSRGVSEGRGVLARLVIYDILGREITTLVNEQLKPSTYEVEWNGNNYPSGVYFYKLITSDPSTSSGQGYSETRKMVLIK